MGPLNRALREWEAFYNARRPRQSRLLNPVEYLTQWPLGGGALAPRCLICAE